MISRGSRLSRRMRLLAAVVAGGCLLFVVRLGDLSGLAWKFRGVCEGSPGGWGADTSDREYFRRVSEVGVRHLKRPRVPPGIGGEQAELLARGFTSADALLADAMVNWHLLSPECRSSDRLEEFYVRYLDRGGGFRDPGLIRYVDMVMHGPALMFLWKRTGAPAYRSAVDGVFRSVQAHPRSEGGVLPYRQNKPAVVLVDTIGMVCPFLAEYGVEFSVPEAVDLSVRQLVSFIDNGMDPESGLPYHGYIEGRDGKIGLPGWCRGTGWFLYGLVGALEHLPELHPSRQRLLESLSAVCGSLMSFQLPGGLWADHIPNTCDEGETSGTAMIACAMEKAMARGYISRSYAPMLDRAFAGIKSETTRRGYVLNASGECPGAAKYSPVRGHYAWAQGAAASFTALYLMRTSGTVRAGERPPAPAADAEAAAAGI